MKHLRVVLILIVLLLGMAGAAIFTANAGAPVGRNTLTPRVYLPLVARGESAPAPGTWITVLEEGFEAAPGPLWQFRDDNGASFGGVSVGPARLPAVSPAATAPGRWAAARMARNLPCGDAYPDNVATTMIYGPFSLADAKMAQVRFKLRYDQVLSGDDFCWFASDAPLLSNATVAGGLCLNAQPSGWTTLDLDLGDLDPAHPGVSVLGKPQVWVAFRFTSDATGHASPGPFVDDVLIRKCLDTLCSPLSAAAPAPGQTRAIRMLPTGQ